MAYRRTSIPWFALGNRAYINALVTFFQVNPTTKARLTTLAPLYSSPTSGATVTNPQTLDGEGKFAVPVYVDEPVIGLIQGAEVGSHETGILYPLQRTFRGAWVSGTTYDIDDVVSDNAAGASTLNLYSAVQEHVAGVWASDLSDVKWALLAPVGTAIASGITAVNSANAAAASATSASASAAAAAASAAGAGVSFDTAKIIAEFPFTGDGTTTIFNFLGINATSAGALLVSINGITQPNTAYSYANIGTALRLTFTEAPPLGSVGFMKGLGYAAPVGTADGSLVSYLAPVTGATYRTVQARLGDTLSVLDFGVVGDGTTDNTATFQTAIDTVAAVGGALHVPVGLYITGPLTIPGTSPGFALLGEGLDNVISSEPAINRGAVIKLKSGSNASLFTVAAECGPIYFRDLFLMGNQAGQTSGSSFGVVFSDQGSGYGRAGKLERVRIERCRSGAVNVGLNRNAGDIVDCTFQNCGYNPDATPVASFGDGLLLGAANDWRVDTLDTGAHSRNGIYCTGAQNLVMYSTMSYANGARGFRMDATAGSGRLVDCMFDRNAQDGVLLLGVGSTTRITPRTLLGCHFGANNRIGTTGIYSDIRIDDSDSNTDPVQIIACSFSDSTDTALEVKYHVEARGTTTGVLLLAPMYRTDSAKAYATSAVSSRTAVNEVEGPVSRNSFRVTTSSSAVNYVEIAGGTAGTPTVTIGADGTGTNIPISLSPKGVSPVYLSSAAPRLLTHNTSGATNEKKSYIDASGALLRFALLNDAETSSTRWMEVGRSGITVSYVALGGPFTAETLRLTPVASQVNHVEVTGAATGSTVKVEAKGSDTNIKLTLAGKGTGGIQLGLSGSEYLGFFGTIPVVKPTVTGSRAGNAAVASLLSVLDTLGLITDSSSI